jgi:hypothetical protein
VSGASRGLAGGLCSACDLSRVTQATRQFRLILSSHRNRLSFSAQQESMEHLGRLGDASTIDVKSAPTGSALAGVGCRSHAARMVDF